MKPIICLYFFFLCLPWLKIGFLKRSYLQSSRSLGEKLLSQLQFLLGSRSCDQDLIQYKFFTGLTQNLLSYRREYGSPINHGLKCLKSGLERDLRFEESFSKEFFGGYAQMIFISCITWGFIKLTREVIPSKESLPTNLWGILLLQLMGLVFYGGGVYLLKRYKLRAFESFFMVIYHLQALSSVGTSPGQAIKEAQVAELFKTRKLKFFQQRLEESLTLWRTYGAPIQDELKNLLDELWHSFERACRELKKALFIVRFLLIISFFLSGYFWYLLGLFGDILTL